MYIEQHKLNSKIYLKIYICTVDVKVDCSSHMQSQRKLLSLFSKLKIIIIDTTMLKKKRFESAQIHS